jgi:hypothetical protein
VTRPRIVVPDSVVPSLEAAIVALTRVDPDVCCGVDDSLQSLALSSRKLVYPVGRKRRSRKF